MPCLWDAALADGEGAYTSPIDEPLDKARADGEDLMFYGTQEDFKEFSTNSTNWATGEGGKQETASIIVIAQASKGTQEHPPIMMLTIQQNSLRPGTHHTGHVFKHRH